MGPSNLVPQHHPGSQPCHLFLGSGKVACVAVDAHDGEGVPRFFITRESPLDVAPALTVACPPHSQLLVVALRDGAIQENTS